MIKVTLTPLNETGELSSQEIDISNDVDRRSLARVNQVIEGSDYDVGRVKISDMTLRLSNYKGRYSDIQDLRSIFGFSRSGSVVKIYWAPQEPLVCGFFKCGEAILSEWVLMFDGILDDSTSRMNIEDQIIDFKILSFDSILDRLLVPTLTTSDDLESAIFKCLNQSRFTKYVSVDESDINCLVNYTIDDVDPFDGKTVGEVMPDLLLAANSVLLIEGAQVKVFPRNEIKDLKRTFYGQASEIGNEDILAIKDFTSGQNRIINFVSWKDSNVSASDAASIELWGVRKQELDIEFVTNTSKRQDTGGSIIDVFKTPKREMVLNCALDYKGLFEFFDVVKIDYPSVYTASGERLPVVGLAVIGDPLTPLPQLAWAFTISLDSSWRVLGKSFDLRREIVELKLREV